MKIKVETCQVFVEDLLRDPKSYDGVWLFGNTYYVVSAQFNSVIKTKLAYDNDDFILDAYQTNHCNNDDHLRPVVKQNGTFTLGAIEIHSSVDKFSARKWFSVADDSASDVSRNLGSSCAQETVLPPFIIPCLVKDCHGNELPGYAVFFEKKVRFQTQMEYEPPIPLQHSGAISYSRWQRGDSFKVEL